MTWMDWLFIVISIVWISEFILFPNRSGSDEAPMERRSFLLIFIALGAMIAAAMGLQELSGAGVLVQAMQAIGIILFAMGVFLRFWGILHLKSQFTRNVTVQQGDEIVSTGPYRLLRHPLYTALLLIGIGMSLYFTSLIAAGVGGVFLIAALLKRIRYEEGLLIRKFGTDYELWMKKRARLIPFIY